MKAASFAGGWKRWQPTSIPATQQWKVAIKITIHNPNIWRTQIFCPPWLQQATSRTWKVVLIAPCHNRVWEIVATTEWKAQNSLILTKLTDIFMKHSFGWCKYSTRLQSFKVITLKSFFQLNSCLGEVQISGASYSNNFSDITSTCFISKWCY